MLYVTVLKQRTSASQMERRDCSAILLAAGVGRRLGDDHDGPKVLLTFEGRSLLARHMAALYANGVRRLSITVGFEGERVRSAMAKILAGSVFPDLKVEFIENPDYRQGSLVSLHAQGKRLRDGGEILLMDGDVLYDARMIARLFDGGEEGVLLVDREIEPGDEPVKICFDDEGRIVDFRKAPTAPHAWFGESVGFFRFSGSLAADLADRCAWYVDRDLVKIEYEEAIRDLIQAEPARFGAEDVSDLPWTEIDFPEDVVKARDIVLPQLRV
jgi:choline kinase